MQGQLFTGDFLRVGITESSEWKAIPEASVTSLAADLAAILRPFSLDSQINEAVTEDEIILKVLGCLGWSDLLRQQTAAKRREDVPDILLFSDSAAKSLALAERHEDRRYRHGIVIVESKRWLRPLDRGDQTDRLDAGTPSNQILRYLSAVEVASERRIRWGVLTNGRQWRLYFQGARSRSEEYVEFDLAYLAGLPGVQAELGAPSRDHSLKLFMLLFGRGSFLPRPMDSADRTFHEIALAETRHWEGKVSDDLGVRVFSDVFPKLAAALAENDPQANRPFSRAYLDELRDASLILLYRLLFVFYAEDRDLLPVRDRRYDDYSLRAVRASVAERMDRGDIFSDKQARIWDDLSRLFAAISTGDESLGLPAYNGGLFEAERTSLIRRSRIPDRTMAEVIDALSRRPEGDARVWINYRDLSVQHLGSVYERLLDFLLVDEGGQVVARPQSFARRVSGSYYTHDDLVKLIIETAVGPLVRERVERFRERSNWLHRKKSPTPADWSALASLDPADAILDLRICDPAMGSGHFLVALVDYLADEVLEKISIGEQAGTGRAGPYMSPVLARISDIRRRILASAKEHRWFVDEAQLDDRHIIRRMILKRVIHGVDKNPMAVELAKVALWLHTFTVGAPLSFLDHHLRCGDALHGEEISVVVGDLRKLGALFQESEIQRIRAATSAMEEIAALVDIDVAEAHRSKELLDAIDRDLAPLRRLLDFWRALRWAIPGWSGEAFRKRSFAENRHAEGLTELFSGGYDLLRILQDGAVKSAELFGRAERQVKAQLEATRIIEEARRLAEREHFLHWAVAFPSVWGDADFARRGFDAVIGNPPWDRIKLQEVEWFAERRPAIAGAVRASDRKRMIEALAGDGDPLWTEYRSAAKTAEDMSRVVRECGDYPLLSGGDVNLYSLFVERASALVKPTGIVGLLTPSGISADKGAAEFFKSISQTGRLGALFDFENKKVFFPDIHASFKFSVLVFGGSHRVFKRTACAFYLHSVRELTTDRLLELSADDFRLVNPNTGGAPIFRTRRDAEITTRIYRDFPILARHEDGKASKVWPVRYMSMFHMTNDSHLFKRKDELEKEGWYPVSCGRWRRGEAEAVPLYVGRMVHQFDHRAASVVVNEANIHNVASSGASVESDRVDPHFSPTPQFWITNSDIPASGRREWSLAFRDIARATDARTCIASIIPSTAAGNTLPLIVPDPDAARDYAKFAPLLLANLNSMAFDYVVRQKAQSTHLNWYILEQLPVVRADAFDQTIGDVRISDFVRSEVLILTYTAHDLAPFGRDLGHGGPPFVWNEDDRRDRIARLDALFFHLYRIGKDDADYILGTFPIVREQDEAAFGRYLTRDLILAYMNAIAARDLTTRVSV